MPTAKQVYLLCTVITQSRYLFGSLRNYYEITWLFMLDIAFIQGFFQNLSKYDDDFSII